MIPICCALRMRRGSGRRRRGQLLDKSCFRLCRQAEQRSVLIQSLLRRGSFAVRGSLFDKLVAGSERDDPGVL